MVVRFKAAIGASSRTKAVRANGGSSLKYARAAESSMAKIRKEYERWVKHIQDQNVDVLTESLQPTLELAKVYTPYEFGDLRNSGYVETRRQGTRATSEIGFGKAGHPSYATYVHERVDIKHEAPTRSKFLEAALNEDAGALKLRILAKLREASGV
jgi:hypothetical protein